MHGLRDRIRTGTAIALVAPVVIALPRDADRGTRHNAVRAVRGGVQRLDSTESTSHVVEDPEAVLTVATDGLGDFAVSASRFACTTSHTLTKSRFCSPAMKIRGRLPAFICLASWLIMLANLPLCASPGP